MSGLRAEDRFRHALIVAVVDGEPSPREMVFLNRLAAQLGIPPQRASEITSEVSYAPSEPPPFPSSWSEKLELFEMMVQTACADGSLGALEARFLEGAREKLGIRQEAYDALVTRYIPQCGLTEQAGKQPRPATTRNGLKAAMILSTLALLAPGAYFLWPARDPFRLAVLAMHRGESLSSKQLELLSERPDQTIKEIKAEFFRDPGGASNCRAVVTSLLLSGNPRLVRLLLEDLSRATPELLKGCVTEAIKSGQPAVLAKVTEVDPAYGARWIREGLKSFSESGDFSCVETIFRAVPGSAGHLLKTEAGLFCGGDAPPPEGFARALRSCFGNDEALVDSILTQARQRQPREVRHVYLLALAAGLNPARLDDTLRGWDASTLIELVPDEEVAILQKVQGPQCPKPLDHLLKRRHLAGLIRQVEEGQWPEHHPEAVKQAAENPGFLTAGLDRLVMQAPSSAARCIVLAIKTLPDRDARDWTEKTIKNVSPDELDRLIQSVPLAARGWVLPLLRTTHPAAFALLLEKNPGLMPVKLRFKYATGDVENFRIDMKTNMSAVLAFAGANPKQRTKDWFGIESQVRVTLNTQTKSSDGNAFVFDVGLDDLSIEKKQERQGQKSTMKVAGRNVRVESGGRTVVDTEAGINPRAARDVLNEFRPLEARADLAMDGRGLLTGPPKSPKFKELFGNVDAESLLDVILPEGAVREGDSWKHVNKVTMLADLNLTKPLEVPLRLTLEKVEGSGENQIATIVQEADETFRKIESEGQMKGLVQAKVILSELKVTCRIRTLFSPYKGRILESALDAEVKGKMEMTPVAQRESVKIDFDLNLTKQLTNRATTAAVGPPRMDNPWADEAVGSWFRMRTTAGGQETYTDLGLKSRDLTSYLLVTETSGGASQEQRMEPAPISVVGEETLTIDGRGYPCKIQETPGPEGVTKSWVLVGRHAGAVVKRTGPGVTLTASRLWENSPRVGGRLFECLVVESNLQDSSGNRYLKTWYCSSLPMKVFKDEWAGGSTSLVDHGSDWSKRPPFPK